MPYGEPCASIGGPSSQKPSIEEMGGGGGINQTMLLNSALCN